MPASSPPSGTSASSAPADSSQWAEQASASSTPPAVVIEAPTVEEALAQVAERLGSDADIVSVEKVLRGGIGGFFAREQVQITVRPRDAAAGAGVAARSAAASASSDGGMQQLLSHLANQNDAEERSFADTLRAHLGTPPGAESGSIRPPDAPPAVIRAVTQTTAVDEVPAPRAVAPTPLPPLPSTMAVAEQPAVAEPAASRAAAPSAAAPVAAEEIASAPQMHTFPAAPAAAPMAPAPAPEAPPAPAPAPAVTVSPARPSAPAQEGAPEVPLFGSAPAPGMPDWSQDNLRRLGLPPLVVDATAGLDPRDDLSWVYAIGKAVATMCRPMPTGDAVLAGPRATRFGGPWKLPTVRPGGQPPRRGSFVAPVRDTEQGRSWLAWAKGSRWLHLVVGGDRWRELLFDEPLAVSWVGNDTLPEAITLSANLGLVLGYWLDGKDAQPRRANPVDVAMAIRSMVPRR